MVADRLPITIWVLREQRRALALWTLALVAVSAMYTAFYPSMANEDMEALIAGLPEALRVGMGWDAIATGAGYLESTVYGLLAPALLLVFGIANGARLLAGDEESGALELESTAPISRRGLALQRFGALAFALTVLCAGLGVITLILSPALGLDIAAANIVAATLGLWLFALAMAAVTFATGAATGRRGTALGVGASIAVAAYIANAVSPMLDGGAWLERASPFGWYLGGDPLNAGIDPAGFGALAVLTVAAVAIGIAVLERRDLQV